MPLGHTCDGEIIHSHTRYAMGCLLTVKIWDREKSFAASVIQTAIEEVRRIERLLSIFREDSEITRINQHAAAGPLQVDHEALSVIHAALAVAEHSNGAYDPTAAPLIRLWGFGKGAMPPSPHGMASDLPHEAGCVGYRHLAVDLNGGILFRNRKGVTLDLGGIGKGYALDRAANILRSFGIEKGLLSFGSTMVAIGPPEGQPPFQIGIQHPRNNKQTIGTVLMHDQALSTSGDYERYRVVKGKRISHLIDPRTGYPAQGVASASVIAPTGLFADALSTAAFVLGPEEGIRLLDSLEKVEGVILATEDQGLSIQKTDQWSWAQTPWAEGINRRRFLKGAAALLAGLFFSPLLYLQPAFAQRFLSEEEAAKQLMPTADRFEPQEISLTPEQIDQAQDLVGKRFREIRVTVYKGLLQGEIVGYGFILDVTGKERPITFMIGVDPEGKIIGIEVMVYRESQGFEIRSRRFMKQFLGKGLESNLELGDDIVALSGATLSSQAASYAARKALALHAALFGKQP